MPEVSEQNRLAERLTSVLGDESQRQFAHRVGVSPPTVLRWLRGERSPDADEIRRICEKYSVDANWLLGLPGGKEPRDLEVVPEPEPPDRYVYVPRYELEASAGHGGEVRDEWIVSSIPILAEHVRVLGLAPSRLDALVVAGDSMTPVLLPGDLIVIERTDGQLPTDGIYLLRIEGSLLVKRVQRLPGKRIRVISANVDYPAFELGPEDAREVEIIGRVALALKRI